MAAAEDDYLQLWQGLEKDLFDNIYPGISNTPLFQMIRPSFEKFFPHLDKKWCIEMISFFKAVILSQPKDYEELCGILKEKLIPSIKTMNDKDIAKFYNISTLLLTMINLISDDEETEEKTE